MDDLLTTRQLQDLLRVDRITIHRMLKDGRLRGLKVGGQWRFSRSEIEVWLQEQQFRAGWAIGSSLPEDGPLPISQMLPLGCIRASQLICAEAMGNRLGDNGPEWCVIVRHQQLLRFLYSDPGDGTREAPLQRVVAIKA